jgi:hypothetical protein
MQIAVSSYRQLECLVRQPQMNNNPISLPQEISSLV